jgi:hypothetical protein
MVFLWQEGDKVTLSASRNFFRRVALKNILS